MEGVILLLRGLLCQGCFISRRRLDFSQRRWLLRWSGWIPLKSGKWEAMEGSLLPCLLLQGWRLLSCQKSDKGQNRGDTKADDQYRVVIEPSTCFRFPRAWGIFPLSHSYSNIYLNNACNPNPLCLFTWVVIHLAYFWHTNHAGHRNYVGMTARSFGKNHSIWFEPKCFSIPHCVTPRIFVASRCINEVFTRKDTHSWIELKLF